MNVNFYKKLLSFRTHSRTEAQIIFRDWLRNYIHENYKGIQSDTDKYGNLYIQKGNADTLNCVIAHLDINQKTKSDNIFITTVDDWILGIDRDTGNQIGLGHDDKAGVYFALQALKQFDNIKVFFPLDEEVGLVGTRACELGFFHNVGFMVQLDRRGSSDISNYTNGNDVLTKETKEELQKICDKYGYKFARCISTDVGNLVERLEKQGCNISCGYYDEHSDREVLNIKEYDNAQRFAMEVLKQTDGKTYIIEKKKYIPPTNTYKHNSGGTYGANRSGYESYYGRTNSRVGSSLSVVPGGKTNANSHRIIRDEPTAVHPRPIDTHDRPAVFVNSANPFDLEDNDCGLSDVPVIEKSLEDKVNEFQFAWSTETLNLEEIALADTEVLIHGYKQIINHVTRETTIEDEKVIEILEDLQLEVELVEEAGNHNLVEVKDFIVTTSNMLKGYVASGKRLI